MKILIFSVSTGQGHNATAKAIRDEMQRRGWQAEVDDAVFRANRLLGYFTDVIYRLAISSLRFFYGIFYRLAEKRKANSYSPSLSRFNNRILARRLRAKIEKDDPDIILCTHAFPSAALDAIKQRHPFRAKCVGVVTDFTVHPFWEDALRFDLIALPDEGLLPEAEKKGFRPEQLAVTGIPIQSRFYQQTDKENAKEALGLAKDKKTLLVMSGSMGHGNIKRNLKKMDALPDDFQLIVVCGTNRRMYRHIAKTHFSHLIKLYGYTDQIPLLMSAADCVISKPGGLSTSEALAKGLPLIIVDPIPGHEERNAAYLKKAGAALVSDKRAPLFEEVARFLREEALAVSLKEAVKKLYHPQSVVTLCDRIEKMADMT